MKKTTSLRHALLGGVLAAVLGLPSLAAWAAPTNETIVLFRHGEKPEKGFGQLNCQGLNRALALPDVLLKKYGKPQLLVAPNPSSQKTDWDVLYDYIRPLATIEPTAIRLEMPVNTQLGFNQTSQLADLLLAPEQANKTVFVAWEHKLIDVVAKEMLQRLQADPAVVPKWQREDFDSLYRIDIQRDGDKVQVTFKHEAQHLNHQSKHCPAPAQR